MTKYLVNTETAIKNIADAIRVKTGSSADLTVADMPAAINNISGGGGTHTVTINVDDCSIFTFDFYSSDTGSCSESENQQLFAEVIENFSVGKQVTVHLTSTTWFSDNAPEGINSLDATVVGVYEFEDQHTFSGYNYPMVTGACFIATTVFENPYDEQVCKSIIFVANSGTLIYGST